MFKLKKIKLIQNITPLLIKGIEYSDTDLISVRIKALNPGKAKIQATVQLPGGQKISSFVEVVGKIIIYVMSYKN